jgi:DNA-binding CsgD family transcriptional regulator
MKNNKNQKEPILLEVYDRGKFKGYIYRTFIEKEIKNKENKNIENYLKLHENSITNNLSYTLNKSKKDSDFISIDMLGTGIVKVGNIEYEIMKFQKNKSKIYVSASKLLIYAILNMTGNISMFKINDYMNFRNLLDRKNARQSIKNDLLILQSISNIKHISKNKELQITSSIITDTDYCYGVIKIIFNKKFATQLKKNYMYIPENLIKINDRNYPHVWPLGYYIFEYSRINKLCEFELTIKSCLNRLLLPNYEYIKNINRNFSERIINPFENTIDTLQEYLKDLSIEYKNPINTIEDFFNNKIKIKINNNYIRHYYKEIKLNEDRRKIEKNIDNKNKRKLDTLKLLQEKKSIKEITQILKLTPRTIRNYIKELKTENKL